MRISREGMLEDQLMVRIQGMVVCKRTNQWPERDWDVQGDRTLRREGEEL